MHGQFKWFAYLVIFKGKEIRLKHGAPVIGISIVDRAFQPLPAPLAVQNEQAKAPDMTGGHHVIIASEEQLKVREPFSLYRSEPVNIHEGKCQHLCWPFLFLISFSDLDTVSDWQMFSLPNLKASHKCKLCTRHDTARLNNANFSSFRGKSGLLLSKMDLRLFISPVKFALSRTKMLKKFNEPKIPLFDIIC